MQTFQNTDKRKKKTLKTMKITERTKHDVRPPAMMIKRYKGFCP